MERGQTVTVQIPKQIMVDADGMTSVTNLELTGTYIGTHGAASHLVQIQDQTIVVAPYQLVK